MIGHRISMLESQNLEILKWLNSDPNGFERGVILLFRRLARQVNDQTPSDRFLVVDYILMSDDWIIDSSKSHLEINMRKLPEVYFRCETDGLELGFAHNHPNGYSGFSPIDDTNEQNILFGLSGCNGDNAFLISMVLSDDMWHARARQGSSPEKVLPIRHICINGHNMKLHGVNTPSKLNKTLERQEVAFGKPFNSKLQSLRAVVVGAGGTGSAIVTLLARLGIGELIIIDGDILEKSNMNRVRGFNSEDIGKNKAISLVNYIDTLGLDITVSAIGSYLHDSDEAIDALSSADVIFGCTDDYAGRELMNQAVYYYSQVYIDVGLTGLIALDDDGQPYLRDHRGRVSCILPESGACLRCQGIITDKWLDFEQATKYNPDLTNLDSETLEREYYLTGGGEQAPGIGPFTSSTADIALATLMNLIRPYRATPSDIRQDNIWIDFVHMNIHSNYPQDNPECIYCSSQSILLKREDKYRLDMPALGEINVDDD